MHFLLLRFPSKRSYSRKKKGFCYIFYLLKKCIIMCLVLRLIELFSKLTCAYVYNTNDCISSSQYLVCLWEKVKRSQLIWGAFRLCNYQRFFVILLWSDIGYFMKLLSICYMIFESLLSVLFHHAVQIVLVFLQMGILPFPSLCHMKWYAWGWECIVSYCNYYCEPTVTHCAFTNTVNTQLEYFRLKICRLESVIQ